MVFLLINCRTIFIRRFSNTNIVPLLLYTKTWNCKKTNFNVFSCTVLRKQKSVQNLLTHPKIITVLKKSVRLAALSISKKSTKKCKYFYFHEKLKLHSITSAIITATNVILKTIVNDRDIGATYHHCTGRKTLSIETLVLVASNEKKSKPKLFLKEKFYNWICIVYAWGGKSIKKLRKKLQQSNEDTKVFDFQQLSRFFQKLWIHYNRSWFFTYYITLLRYSIMKLLSALLHQTNCRSCY